MLESFTLTAPNEAAVPGMLNTALVRIDLIYRDALARGLLTPDPTLMAGERQLDAALGALAARLQAAEAGAKAPSQTETETTATPEPQQTQAAPTISTVTVQFATPDAAAVDAALGAVRGAPGVRGAATSSIAIGGTSVMRVTLAGDINALASALRAQGWQVSVGAGALRISR
jgi:hypothetical protein